MCVGAITLLLHAGLLVGLLPDFPTGQPHCENGWVIEGWIQIIQIRSVPGSV